MYRVFWFLTPAEVKLRLRLRDKLTSFLSLTCLSSVSVLLELLLFSWVASSDSAPALPTDAFQRKELLYICFYSMRLNPGLFCNISEQLFRSQSGIE